MDYKEYINSINPPIELGDKASAKVKAAKRTVFVKPALAAATLIIIITGTLLLTLPKNNAPERVVPTIKETTTESYITTYMPDDTIKSMPLFINIEGREYYEVRSEQISIKETDLQEWITITDENITGDSKTVLGAKVYKIQNDNRLIVEFNEQYLLFAER